MSLVTNLQSAFTRVATEFKSVYALTGLLANLSTTNKSNLVAAINEVNAKPSGGGGGTSGPAIDDNNATTYTTYSSSKTNSQITTQITNLLNGAPTTFDTLKEIADYIANDQSISTALTNGLATRVRVDGAQSFTDNQKSIGRSNIGAVGFDDIGNAAQNFVADFEAALA